MLTTLTKVTAEQFTTNEQAMRQLAQEIARGILDADQVLENHNISAEEFNTLAQTRAFQQMLEAAVKEWSGAGNTSERVKLKASVAVEEALPHMFAELTNKDHPLSSRADLFGRLARIGGLGNEKPGGGSGEIFKIEINLGDDKSISVQQPLLSKVITDADYEEI